MTTKPKRVNYRKAAFDHWEERGQVVCAHCGFGIKDVLEVAHLDGDRSHNEIDNLAILCPNCHKMFDLDLITVETIILMRDRPKVVVWAKRMKDAGAKAAVSRLKTLEKRKWKSAGQKAAATRKRNAAETPAKKSEPIEGVTDVEGTRSQVFVGGVRKPQKSKA